MKYLILFIGISIIPYFSISQNVNETGKKAKNFVSSEYNRNSLTLVGLNFQENLSNEMYQQFETLAVPEKYYENPLGKRVLFPDKKRSEVTFLTKVDEKEIARWLNQNKVGQEILAKWFNRQADGSFNVNVLKERGLFNANDNDFIVASASKRGESSLMDMGMQLVNQSYVVVFDFAENMTMTQYYEKNETEEKNRVSNGYRTTLNSYLFKLDFNDSVAAVFFQNYWIGANDMNKKDKISAFENASFPFVFQSKHLNHITGTQLNPNQKSAPREQKTPEQLIAGMVKTGLESTLTNIENKNEAFRVKGMVSDVRPIAVKIGKKEGLKFDQRYFVYENRTKRNGDVTSKRVAVVKSMKVVDNRNITTGQTDPSLFYQIAGGRVDNFGMFLEQHNDVGLNVFLGQTIGGMEGFTGRAEFYISKAMGGNSGKKARGLTSIKLYIEGAYGEKPYEDATATIEDFTFARGSVGLAKDFYPLSFLHWGPFIGYGVESAAFKDYPEQDKVSTDFVEMGVRAGLNLSHNIQLIGSFNYYMMISSEMVDSNKEVVDEDFDYKSFFEDRMTSGTQIGIRFMF